MQIRARHSRAGDEDVDVDLQERDKIANVGPTEWHLRRQRWRQSPPPLCLSAEESEADVARDMQRGRDRKVPARSDNENIDSMDELSLIKQLSEKHSKVTDIGIRLALDLDPLANLSGVAMHGPGTLKEQSDSTKWGMSREQTVEIVKEALSYDCINLKETHFHLSRMTNEVGPFAVMAKEIVLIRTSSEEISGISDSTSL